MRKLWSIVFGCTILFGCKHSTDYDSYESINVDPSLVENVQDSTLSKAVGIEVENKIFKTTAKIEMKVGDLQRKSFELEENALRLGGFVLSSHMSNRILGSDEVEITSDSILKVLKVQKFNEITLKIPTGKIREHLLFATKQGIYIESLIVENTELTFQKLENDLNISNSRSKKAEEVIEDQVWKAILSDNLKFATITYKLHQDPNVITYQSPIIEQKLYQKLNLMLELKKAWKDGVYGFKIILIYLVKILPTIGFIVIFTFGIRWVLKKSK